MATPTTSTGVFSITCSKLIDAPIEKVWAVLLDFPSYGEWNPFARSVVIVTSSKKPEEDQKPALGKHLLMKVHIPPSMEEKRKAIACEVITTFDEENHRVDWQNIDYPRWLMRVNRTQTLISVESGTRYETTEVFEGVLAYFVKWFLRKGLCKGFAEMAEGLKRCCEQS